MRKLLILPIILWCTSAMGAELLVMARDCPSSDAYHKGDVVSVAEDGFYEKFTGYTLENGFVIQKRPGISVEDVKLYEQPLIELIDAKNPLKNVSPTKNVMITSETNIGVIKEAPKIVNTIRVRKYAIPVSEVDTVVSTGINTQTIFNFQNDYHPVLEKTVTEEKADIALGAGIDVE